MFQHHGQPFATQVLKLSAAQLKATPEGRSGERREEFVKIAPGHVPRPFHGIFPHAPYTASRRLIARTISSGVAEMSR